jgi:hypothetical protein
MKAGSPPAETQLPVVSAAPESPTISKEGRLRRLWHWFFPAYLPLEELRSKSAYVRHFAKVRGGSAAFDASPPYNQEAEEKPWLSETHQLALDIRKFEIEHYWKRASYFWTLITAAFAGFFALATNGKHPRLVFLVSCIGVILSLGWYLVNRGSKYWQENWERHVDVLEDEIVGPLYKTTIAREEYRWLKFWQGYPYSVSKINQLISLFVALVWIGLAVASFPEADYSEWLRVWSSPLLAVGTLLVVILLLVMGKTGPERRPRKVNFRVSPLGSEADEEPVD